MKAYLALVLFSKKVTISLSLLPLKKKKKKKKNFISITCCISSAYIYKKILTKILRKVLVAPITENKMQFLISLETLHSFYKAQEKFKYKHNVCWNITSIQAQSELLVHFLHNIS